MSTNTCGSGKYKVWLKKSKVGDDLVYLIGGGEKAHVGGITVCEPGKKPRNVKLPGHYDYLVTEPIAKAACKRHKVKVTCIGGVRVDNATKTEVKKLVANCKGLMKWI